MRLVAEHPPAVISPAIGALALLPALPPAGAIGAVAFKKVGVSHPLGGKALVLLVGGRASVAIAGDIARLLAETGIAGARGEEDRPGGENKPFGHDLPHD